MREESNQTGFFVGVSIVASVLLHLAIWVIAAHVPVSLYEYIEPIERPNRPVTVHEVTINDLPKPKPMPREEIKKQLVKQQVTDLHKLFKEQHLNPPVQPELKPVLTGLGRDLLKKVVAIEKPNPNDSVGTAPRSSPLPSIIQSKTRDLPPDRTMKGRVLTPDLDREVLTAHLPSSVATPTPGTGLGTPQDVGLGMRLGSVPPRPPTSLDPLVLSEIPRTPTPPIQQNQPKTLTPAADVLDPLLKVEVSVYRDKKTGDGYFSVEINTNEAAARLQSIPKDVLFLVDCSASIGNPKLHKFRDGLALAMDYLLPEDHFNVVAFRDQPKALFPSMVPVAPDNVRQARDFVDDLTSRGKTDVYAGVAPYVTQERPDPNRPYLIFVMSDGRTTTGHELTNNQFIKQVTKENRAHASIFSFSAGDETNLFLMDYLSYKNRGFSLHTAELATADDDLTKYIGGLSDIIVADLSCRVTGNLQGDIYPRELPHLFRGHPLTVYGKVPPKANIIGVQVRGRSRDGKTEELVHSFDLADATRTGPELATAWAAQKIYYLISEWTVTNDEALRKEIAQLADQYNILVPY